VSPSDYGWQPIEPHEIVLEGFDGAVKITVDSLLATSSTLARPDALGMTTTVRIDRPNSSPSIEISTNHAYYGSLASLSDSVLAFRLGRSTDISINAVGFRLRLYEHHFGARSGTCVTGDVSDVLEVGDFPWPAEDIGNRLLLQREASFHLRFAFQTSVFDPPFVTRFADSIHQLVRYVQSLGAS
jgi:hypothetical protein